MELKLSFLLFDLHGNMPADFSGGAQLACEPGLPSVLTQSSAASP